MRFARTGSRRKRQHFDKTFFKTGVACRSYLLKTSRHRLPAGAALASQGPGGGPGTAGELTQMVMGYHRLWDVGTGGGLRIDRRSAAAPALGSRAQSRPN